MKFVRDIMPLVGSMILCVLGSLFFTYDGAHQLGVNLLGSLSFTGALIVMEEYGRAKAKSEISDMLISRFLSGHDSTIDVTVNVKDERL